MKSKINKLIKKWRREAKHRIDCGDWDLTYPFTLKDCAKELEKIINESK